MMQAGLDTELLMDWLARSGSAPIHHPWCQITISKRAKSQRLLARDRLAHACQVAADLLSRYRRVSLK